MTFPVWIYWETPQGKETPTYISMCLEAIRFWAGEQQLILVEPTNIQEFLPDLSHQINHIHCLTPNQPSLPIKVAFIRAALLRRYGGLYMDIDCLPLAPLGEICRSLDKAKFSAVQRKTASGSHVSIGLMGTSNKNPIINEYYNTLHQLLSSRTGFHWGEAGARSLTPVVNNNLRHFASLTEDFAHPILAENQWMFMSKSIEPSDIFTSRTKLAMLFHRPFLGPSKSIPKLGIPEMSDGWLSGWSPEQLYYGDILLSKMFRTSLPEQVFSAWLAQTGKNK